MTPTTSEVTDNMTDVLRARCTPELKQRLQRVAQRNPMTRDLADHIRYAVERYIESEERKVLPGMGATAATAAALTAD